MFFSVLSIGPTRGVLAAVAEFERDLLIERTHAGLARSRANGVKTGRRESLSPKKQADVLEFLAKQVPVSHLTRDFGTSRQTILRIRKKTESPLLEIYPH